MAGWLRAGGGKANIERGDDALRRARRDELLAGFRRVEYELGHDRFSVQEYMRRTGIPSSVIYRCFESWCHLREAAGSTRRAPGRKHYSDEELLADYHRLVQSLRRLPMHAELGRFARASPATFHNRFGGHNALVERYRQWLAKHQKPADGTPLNTFNTTQPRQAEEHNVRWMQNVWAHLRVGFELKTSDFRRKGLTPLDCDLLVVLENDEPPRWPLKVIELHQAAWPEK